MRRSRSLSISFVLVLPLVLARADRASADSYPRNRDVDVLHYAFALGLNDETDLVEGDARVELRFLTEGVTSLELDLVERGPDGRGMEVLEVSRGGKARPFQHRSNRLRFEILASKAGERRTYRIRYRGQPADGLRIGPNKHGDRTFFSDNWPNRARHWLPLIDHPYEKATSELIVTAPSHYQVISNGLMIEETDLPGARRRTHWKQSVPICSWLYVLGVARFAVQHLGLHDGKPIQTWVYAQDRDAGFYDFAVPTRQAMDFYATFVGPYSYEKLANVQSASVRGGMESATAIFYGEESVRGDRNERWRNVIIHEVAHQWFGNSVTESDWDDVWLSEGFATYFTLLFIEHAYGQDAFQRGLAQSRDRVLDFYRENPGYRIVHDNLSDMSRVTSSQTYQKGAWVLHMLRGLMGDEAFWRGIQRYYQRYRNAHARTDDFRQVMEEAAGRDFSRFFQQWLYRGGQLRVEGRWSYDADQGSLRVELAQVQNDGSSFEMPLQLGIETPDSSPNLQLETLHLDATRKIYELSLPAPPSSVRLDPFNWVLMDAEFSPAKER